MNPPPPSRSQIHCLFPAIVQVTHHGDNRWNREVYERIKAMQQDPSIPNACEQRNVATLHGYQPEVVLHRHWLDDPQWQQFMREMVQPALGRYLAEHQRLAGWPAPGTGYRIAASWCVLYPAGAYQAPHIHRNRFCVLAYYPRVPLRPEPEGAISFINPHLESQYPSSNGWNYHWQLQPRNGTAIVFPGWLQHFSHPHHGSDERMLLTFDIDLAPAGKRTEDR